MLIAGARRFRHVAHIQGDPVVQRLCVNSAERSELKRSATRHTLGRWLRGFDRGQVEALLEVNERLVGDVIERSGLSRLALDADGSVISTGLRAEGARRGFNPHRRKAPSYYPITAYATNTGQVLRVRNRAGNVHDGKASATVLEVLFDQLDTTLKEWPVLEIRMDEAFFREDVQYADQGAVLPVAGVEDWIVQCC